MDAQAVSGPKVDVWSLGIILAELALGIGQLWPELKLAQLMRKVLSLVHCNSDTSVFMRIAREHSCMDKYEVCILLIVFPSIMFLCFLDMLLFYDNLSLQSLPEDITKLINACLQLKPSDRPTPSELLKFPIFEQSLQSDLEVCSIER